MDKTLIQDAAIAFQTDLFSAIKTARYKGDAYENGQKAKEALIRSQNSIRLFHECTKISLKKTLERSISKNWLCFPPVGQNSPELKIYGRIKGKDQDLVYLCEKLKRERITEGPNEGEIDTVGLSALASSIVVGVRSQMSSVDKNFDTLMERAFAETLNLRLRIPTLTMGELYVLPLIELDDQAMRSNQVRFKSKRVNAEKFIKTFNSFSGRADLEIHNQYKYDATALLFLDLKQSPPKVFFNEHDLSNAGFTDSTCSLFSNIKPEEFDDRIVKKYMTIHRL